jgi:ribosomal protein S18 acetylase RimI-like enzyme
MEIIEANLSHLKIISDLAEKIWWPTYQSVISDKQIAFMLEQMYSEKALESQFKEGAQFLLLRLEEAYQGFASYQIQENGKDYKLQKLYLKPELQGIGLGKALITEVENRTKILGADYLYLNVNRGNKAYQFYNKIGYEIFEEIDIPYYEFVLNDYVMRKEL